MITQEEANKFFYSKALEKPNLEKLSEFSATYERLGKIITRTTKEHIENAKKYITQTGNAERTDFKLYNELFEDKDYSFNPFANEEGERLAKFLFGDVLGSTIASVWSRIDTLPYQSGYYRRSFRMKSAKDYHLKKKLYFLTNLYKERVKEKSSALFNMSMSEIVQYMGYTHNGELALPLSVYLERENKEELKALIWDIILAEDEVGVVNRYLIKGLLLSEDRESWEMVGKLLLSAQRQEGLRQSILESLDETSIGALQYMIELILENDLYRFSSVIRAVDTWFGFAWEAPKKATIKKILELASHFLSKPEEIEKQLKKSRNNLELYVALWAKAVIDDVDEANSLAIEIIKNDKTREKKLLAFIFIEETNRTNRSLVPWIYENFAKGDAILDYYMLENLPMGESAEIVAKLFKKILDVALKIPKDGVILKGKVFEWYELKVTSDYFYSKLINYASEDILKELGKDISKIPNEVRENYIQKVFPKQYKSSWELMRLHKWKIEPLEISENSWKRNVLHQALLDKNSTVQTTALNVLRSIELAEKEYEIIELLFKRKSKNLRQFLIEFVLKKDEEFIKRIVKNILNAKDISQRLAGLEILSKLYKSKRMDEFVQKEIKTYMAHPKLSKNEKVLLDKFEVDDKEQTFTHANGYGVVDYAQLKERYIPEDKFATIPKDKNIYDEFIDREKIAKAVDNLVDIFEKYKNYEYTYEGYDGGLETTLLNNALRHKKRDIYKLDKEERFKLFPLYEVWEDWYRESKLNDLEMMVAYEETSFVSYNHIRKPSNEFIARYYPKLKNMKLKIDKSFFRSSGIDAKINEILEELLNAFCDKNRLISFKLDVLESMLLNYPKELLNFRYSVAGTLDEYMDFDNADLENIKRRWLIQMSIFYSKLDRTLTKTSTELAKKSKNIDTYMLPYSRIYLRLYKEGFLNEHDILYYMLATGDAFIQSFEGNTPQNETPFNNLPKELLEPLQSKYRQLKKIFLDIELKRGDSETEVSKYVSKFRKIEGIEYFVRILELIGKSKINRHIFSEMLEKTMPKEGESYEDFQSAIKPLKISKNRWLEIAMYLPRWSEWIGKHIKLEALKDAVWWFRAHGSESYYISDEDKATIAKYSAISIQDFERGALDIDWFNRVYPQIGKANWRTLTEFAKYTAGSHRLVKLYSSIILGDIKIREITQKIKTKRDKDYLRGLGLVPLSKKSPQKDLLSRYNIFQTFLKESKQFGSQRQESEKNAVKIGMENLSRTAGYSDSIRLSLAMETQATNEIMKNATLTFDDITLSLEIDDFGRADIVVYNGEKRQKSIPAKLKKEKAVKELIANKNYLKKQYSRVVKFLEESMVTQEKFKVEELEQLMKHPIVKPLLSKLIILVNGQDIALFNSNLELVLFENRDKRFEPTDSCIIAHSSHMHERKIWSTLQKFAFDTKLVQPFKQIFRELYVVSEDEKESGSTSKRYEGHQIQVKKSLALLKGRGWRVDYDWGLHKVFHKEGYVVYLQAMADWFSPSDIEAPTLEDIDFESLKSGKSINLVDVDKVIFSEVMRDVDLVVSVAHIGGIDPEASHSTLEMRAVLAKESAKLFKLENVEVKKRHIVIDGKLASYSIHLGSGLVSKDGLALSIISVHSQHRGRVFLPFIDDDPKTAEIISKMKLLAEDDKIQDPTVLNQILGE